MLKALILSALLSLSVLPAQANVFIKAVDHVDPAKFVGTWYRISAKPTIFEPTCACAQQILTAKDNGTVGVFNSCNKNEVSGEQVTIKGFATADDSTFAKLSVKFEGVSQTGSYWVIALDEKYRWTAVSDKYGYSLYVMSREPQMSAETYKQVVAAAKANGGPVGSLVMQEQKGCKYPKASDL